MAFLGITKEQLKKAEKNTTTPTDPVVETLRSHRKQIDLLWAVLVTGFIILLVMMGTLIWTAFTDWKHSAEETKKQIQDDRYNLLQQQYQFQQQEMDNIQNTCTTSAKINLR